MAQLYDAPVTDAMMVYVEKVRGTTGIVWTSPMRTNQNVVGWPSTLKLP